MKNFKNFIKEAHDSTESAFATARKLATRESERPGGPRPDRMQWISRALGNVAANLIDKELRDEQINKRRKELESKKKLGEAAETPENDYEGEMASSELRNIIDNAKDIESMLKPSSKLEAWVQSKITKANDYINSVRDYLKNTPGAVEEALDPVGQEDADINNDGVVNGTDRYLRKRRAAIAKAMAKRKGRKKK